MFEIKQKFCELLKAQFHNKVIGGPGSNIIVPNVPSTLRAKIKTFFDQGTEISQPSISINDVVTASLSATMDPGDGLEEFTLDVTVRVDQERQAYSFADRLEKEIRIWLNTVNQNRTLTPDGFTMIVVARQPQRSTNIPEKDGTILARHILVSLIYLRPREVFL